jgi:tetratricopeptide (TPR) repeat protein
MPRHPEAVITPNPLLTELRESLPSPHRLGLCMSRSELADAVNRALYRLYRDRSLAAFYVDARWVGKLERGESRWPSEERRAALRDVFGVATDSDLDLYSPRRTDVLRAGAPPVGSAPAGDWEQALDDLRIEWRLLVENDKLFGPGYALVGVTRQLGHLDRLVGQAPAAFRHDLRRLAARYSESAAWLSQSLNDDAAAERWTRRSFALASRTDDTAMIAWASYRSSQHWLTRRVPERATTTVDIAASHDANLPGPMRAAIRVQQAHALAMTGAHREAISMIDQAHRWAADLRPGKPEGEHGSYCTSGYIEVYRGACLRLAGKPREAVVAIDAALPRIPRLHRQDYASALIGKASAQQAAHEPEAAAVTAQSALSIARRAGLHRLVRSLDELGATLSPHRNLAEVATFLHDLTKAA